MTEGQWPACMDTCMDDEESESRHTTIKITPNNL